MNTLNTLNTQRPTSQPRWRIFKRGKYVLNGCTIATLALLSATSAEAKPVDGNVISGTASITHGTDTVITQSSDQTVITWDKFGTSASESITFNQHLDSDIAINKVLGGQRSDLYGTLTANGTVFILNGAGITFGHGSQTNVGALLATTADGLTQNDDGSFSFIDEGYGSINNYGNITVSNGGFGVLIAPEVRNFGTITADLGEIQLGSSNSFTIDLRGDSLIKYSTESDLEFSLQCGNDRDCVEEYGGVTNGGLLQAKSGKITLTANEVTDITEGVVNLRNGSVLDASAFATDGNGGTILVTADYFTNAESGSEAYAQGGENAGNGGSIEYSGNEIRISNDIIVNASAENGEAGTFIIDPTTVTIADGAGTGAANEVSEDLIETTSNTNGTSITILADEKVTVEAISDGEITGGAGDITLQAGISSSEGVVEFQDLTNTISTTTGDINIIARNSSTDGNGINIGNLKTGGTNVQNPGAINLTTTQGGSIVANDLTVEGTETGAITINSSNDLTVNNITIDIDDSDALITSATLITNAASETKIEGNIVVNARNLSKDGDNEALAKATINSDSVTVYGTTNINAEALVAVPFDVIVEFLSSINAGYNNSVGYYKKDGAGNPIDGEIIWANAHTPTAGDSFTFTTDQLADYGLFIVADGARQNGSLSNNTDVTFQNDAGKWTAYAGGVKINGKTSNGPAFFSDTSLNFDGFNHAGNTTLEGNLNWEDLLNGGDEDFNDVNLNVTTAITKSGDAYADAQLDVTAANGNITMGDTVTVTAKADSNNGNADSSSIANFNASNDVNFNNDITITSTGNGESTDAANGNAQTSLAKLDVTAGGDVNAANNITVNATNISNHGDSNATADADISATNVTVVGNTNINADALVKMPIDILVEYLSSITAGYNNTIGYYRTDASGNPVTGEVVWANIHNQTTGDSFTLTVKELSDFGIFMVSDGGSYNPTLTNNTAVTFKHYDNRWHAFSDSTTKRVRTRDSEIPLFLSKSSLNRSGFVYAKDTATEGNMNWEDIYGGGDEDFNDANLNVFATRKPGDATAIATLNVTTVNGGVNFGDVNVNSNAVTDAGFASSTSHANFNTTEGDVTLANVITSASSNGTTGENADSRTVIEQINADRSGTVSFDNLEANSTLDKLEGQGYTLVKVAADAINFNGNDPLSTVNTTADGSDTTEQERFTTIETSGAVTPDTAEIIIAINDIIPPVVPPVVPPVTPPANPPTDNDPTPPTPPTGPEEPPVVTPDPEVPGSNPTPDSLLDTLRPKDEADLSDNLGAIAPAAGGANANGQYCSVVNINDRTHQNFDPELCVRDIPNTVRKSSALDNFISAVDQM